ncbi:uncharacterized protein LOC129928724 isoform X2 [Biomphalaria glabrata]|uniref:Uncharacterized protein LOC129928724 isoform X2 n=1 Tax=Biomphalaria glabrata TaxID=6526 RepID=A0A9W3BLV6_BIOGL|nr:uncharacterized protein LOC129928724 isoform X2 [Biomphalaria glabrata]
MFLALIFLIFFNFFGLPGVDGATCITKSTCAWTDFTLPLCISGTCKCFNSSFVPIRSGCGLQMTHRPVVSAQQGKTNQVISGQSFELSCYFDKYNDYYTFEWYLGETKLSTRSNTYTAVADENTVGSFTCRVRTSARLLTSPLSYFFEVVKLGGASGQATSNERPTIYVPTNSAVGGSTVILECNNIPMGYTDTIIYTVNGVNTTYSSVVITSANAGKYVTCTLTSPSAGVTYSRPTSAVGNLPRLTTSISSVSVVVGIGTSQRLVCALTPSAIYLQSSPITYTWKANRIHVHTLDNMMIAKHT